MSWSKDQRPAHAHALGASAARASTHPAKSVMDERWAQRRAAANARRAEVSSRVVVVDRADISGVQPTTAAVEAHAAERLLEDMRQLELKDAAHSHGSAQQAVMPYGAGPLWLRDTQRAMLIIAAISCSALLALLYFGGFLG